MYNERWILFQFQWCQIKVNWTCVILASSFTKEIAQPLRQNGFLVFLEGVQGGKFLVFVSSRSVKMRGFSFLSFEESVFILQFLNDKVHNYVKQNLIVHFIVQKLKKNTLSSKVSKLRQLRNLSFWQNESRQKPDISHLNAI